MDEMTEKNAQAKKAVKKVPDKIEIISAYKHRTISIDGFKKGLQIAKPLTGRSKYRAMSISGASINTHIKMLELGEKIRNHEDGDKLSKNFEELLEIHFDRLVQAMKECRAWKITGLVAQDYTKEKFLEKSIPERISFIEDLNVKYTRFLDTQAIADLRDCTLSLRKLSDDDDKIRKLCFLKLMFNNFKNNNIKSEFYTIDSRFLSALVSYRRDKRIKENLEEYISKRRRTVQHDYEKYSKFFSQEDFRELAENIDLASNTLKIAPRNIIEVYCEMSETEAEKEYLRRDLENITKLKEMAAEIINIETKVAAEKTIKDKYALREKQNEERKKKLAEQAEKNKQEAIAKIKEKEKQERDRVIGKDEGNTGKMEQRIKDLQTTPTAKEQVRPVIFAWFEKEDVSLLKRLGTKRLTAFFDKLKRIEAETGVRTSLYLITNAGKEQTVRRLEEFKARAKTAGLPRLVEGALGGYSSFRVDLDKNITDIAKMSLENRKKITLLLSKSQRTQLLPEFIVQSDTDYLRYQFTDKKDKSINKSWLNFTVNGLLSDPRVSKQPLKFLPYIENKCAGIDVVLESQLKGLSQVPEYYKSKYHIAPGKTIKVSIEDIDDFLGISKEQDEEEH